MVLDGCVFELDASPNSAMATAFAEAPPLDTPHDDLEQPICPSTHQTPSAAETGLGEFTTGIHTQGSHSRIYKLYQPAAHVGRQRPLVVMLHGCTQDPDDFAAGTAMNQRAAEQGLFVLYPAQAPDANPHRCWNWFQPGHQQRDIGEPALIAGMTRIEQGVSAQGRRYTRSIHVDDQGQAIAEYWLLHGAGHAWSGGDSRGSYTDAKGPDATLEMLRFFLDHPRAPLH